jgi:quercetin dioxygenase-like cupin family protein
VDDGIPHSHCGDVVVNPVTGERGVVLVGTGDCQGDRLAVELRVTPAGAVAAEHYHPSITERFRVIAGRLEATIDGRRRALEKGDDVTVPPGTVHDWWNESDEEVRVLVDVSPGRRFELFVTTLFGLAREGKTNAKGLPGPLQLAVTMTEFRDTIRLTKPPPAVQRALFAPLALIGRARGRRGFYPEYLEPGGHEEPDPDVLALVD